jgi:hypothetical protein
VENVLADRRNRCRLARQFDSNPGAAWVGVFLLMATHAGLLAYSATRHSPTIDEPAHLVAGLSHLKFGRFELYRANPPLVRIIAALPVMVAGFDEDWRQFYDSPGARPEFAIGEKFVAANGERSVWLFTIARWACIPISLVGGLFCFLWSRELWGHNIAGLISLTLWCFEPNILAHAELITPDCAAASFGLGAGYFFWRWLRRPIWGRALWAGLLFGLAELSKMTWFVLFALWPLLWLTWRWTERRRAKGYGPTSVQTSPAISSQIALPPVAQLASILAIGLYVLNAGYGFDGTCTRLKEFTFISSALTGLDHSGKPGNRLTETWMGDLPAPVPRQYLLGMDLQKHDFENYGQKSYLRGEWKNGGWWYYYLYGLAVKVPHGTQFLLILAVFTAIFNRWRRRACDPSNVSRLSPQNCSARDLVILIAPALSVLVLVSSQLEFNHHVRYVLPVLGFTFVFVGVTSTWFTDNTIRT